MKKLKLKKINLKKKSKDKGIKSPLLKIMYFQYF